MQLENGWLCGVRRVPSPHCDARPQGELPSVLVIHNISLPAGEFGGPYIDHLFSGTLATEDHPSFAELRGLRVSAHCLIRRDGQIVQYVPFEARAWHAGVSRYQGRERCNDFSVGIELEGTDSLPYTSQQYRALAEVSATLMHHYPMSPARVTGHSDIAPGRKSDPGQAFCWQTFHRQLREALAALEAEEISSSHP
ncbi:1,6-anhydro-N-acetylmuramyl-L-alanine amidase AmpD [Edwardsiella tarda]|uniref:1,6-anhydro-N-acetylmuramyl-L-alanine amidase AmpD n=1 Tax=Edwardsiella tarda ATCC 15947 = NBRC 105688 TaxID=667121 RepID=A0AC61TG24_EDWTA|nr:1,6-anhydro-N-acetylmuramyl-L-alanine amidase AmpD [Edwardsiella tarda]UAL57321.1 1,6-anhydro-N-acetylmuramyl-L-alanine amidase AmpD [Edwardsiella tarda]UCP99625.1 1,6-anhydro-N-acetylmuramyl-L-alanine amidase AmpD [Edwardsiella tarda ATCC 15947 = NBRC 105688]UCQ27085.1 1,6-anhydro-N-acetylmuramyl-L-alanine amidase AmpD [Edwardsiella tarda]STD30637.1 1,6-anhydro-N-acetylmuramyl-L-alanine amidase AmpD [Edwardsiella tarda]